MLDQEEAQDKVHITEIYQPLERYYFVNWREEDNEL